MSKPRVELSLDGRLALSIPEAAMATGLSRGTIYNRIADGSLRATKVVGRRLILRDDLEAFLRRESGVQ